MGFSITKCNVKGATECAFIALTYICILPTFTKVVALHRSYCMQQLNFLLASPLSSALIGCFPALVNSATFLHALQHGQAL